LSTEARSRRARGVWQIAEVCHAPRLKDHLKVLEAAQELWPLYLSVDDDMHSTPAPDFDPDALLGLFVTDPSNHDYDGKLLFAPNTRKQSTTSTKVSRLCKVLARHGGPKQPKDHQRQTPSSNISIQTLSNNDSPTKNLAIKTSSHSSTTIATHSSSTRLSQPPPNHLHLHPHHPHIPQTPFPSTRPHDPLPPTQPAPARSMNPYSLYIPKLSRSLDLSSRLCPSPKSVHLEVAIYDRT